MSETNGILSLGNINFTDGVLKVVALKIHLEIIIYFSTLTTVLSFAPCKGNSSLFTLILLKGHRFLRSSKVHLIVHSRNGEPNVITTTACQKQRNGDKYE